MRKTNILPSHLGTLGLALVCELLLGCLPASKTQTPLQENVDQCLQAQTPAQCQAALPACQLRASVLERQLASPDRDAAQAKAVHKLAWCEENLRQYAPAERHYRQWVQLNQRLHGAEHPEVATSLNDLALVLGMEGKYGEAEQLVRQSLAMRQKLLGAEHQPIAEGLNNLASVLESQGKYGEAEPLYRQALAMFQKLLGAEHPEVAKSLNNLALVLARQGKYGEAEPRFRQALAMLQKLLGAEHPEVAIGLNNLALVLEIQGKYGEAEPVLRQALAMRQKLLGAEHPEVAQGLNNLAFVLQRKGKYGEAEPLFRQALAMYQKLMGPEHPEVARSLNQLASVLNYQGKPGEAERLFRQALAMYQKLLGTEHPEVAACLNNLARTLYREGNYGEAEPLFRQALAMRQKLLAAEHPDVANSLNEVATLLGQQGKYGEAEPLLHQALAIRQKALGAEHPDVAHSLNGLASILESQGKYGEAEPLFRQALAMRQKLLGAEHPEVAHSFTMLADALMRRNQFPAALPLFLQAAAIQEKLLRATSSETRMRAALSLVRAEEDALYGLLLEQPAHRELQRLALTTALLRKGRTTEAGTFANRLLHQSQGNQPLQERFNQWQQLRQQREALLYTGGGKVSTADYRARLTELSLQSDDLESQLGAALPELSKLQPPAFDDILPATAARLPKNGVLVEVVWAKPYNYKATGTESRWAAPHYIAMVLAADQHIAVHDLGGASSVDSQVQVLLAALRNPAVDPKNSAQTLYNQILKPLLPMGAKHLYLSLDGALSLVPFDALHDGSDYLLGRRSFHYLTSGRDLLRTDSERTEQAALVLADPDFGKAAQSPGTAGATTRYQELSTLERLPGARREAEHVGQLLASPPLFDRAATESVVRAAHGPWVLHIAAHGFFRNGQQLAHPASRGASLFSTRKGVLFGDFGTESVTMSGDTDSLSHSALVLAGAAQGDQAKSAAEDGLLTAEEARSLDLFGTQLVVLSACDTGQGELSVGQGVYGLRRAFLVAGAETLVTSLWQVSDAATGLLMERYYRKLLVEKKGRLEGMQEAMKEMKAKYGHPYYWAPFLVVGSDGPLHPPARLSQR